MTTHIYLVQPSKYRGGQTHDEEDAHTTDLMACYSSLAKALAKLLYELPDAFNSLADDPKEFPMVDGCYSVNVAVRDGGLSEHDHILVKANREAIQEEAITLA